MKKDSIALVIMIIILCAAAAAAANGALTAPSGHGGTDRAPFAAAETVESFFADETQYAEMISGKKQRDFNPSALRFEGHQVPYDSKSNTVFIPQDCTEPDWTGSLSVTKPYAQICILNVSGNDKQRCIEENSTFKTALISDDDYMECDLVFTGLPAVCMYNDKGDPEPGEEYAGRICVLDPCRKEYQEADCSFHIRGATSTLFDKKSYRVELSKNASGSDKASFLGFRKDDDWILNSMCTDRTLAREKICYDLWKRLNEMEENPIASSMIEYCELILNNEYGFMVGYRNREIVKVPLDEVAGKLKYLDPDATIIKEAKLTGICFGD